MLKRIYQMHSKFKMTPGHVPFSQEEKKFRIACMQEELDEYKEANTFEDELDAIVDLVVFALGTSCRQDTLHVFETAFDRVMDANMKKKLGPNNKRGSFHLDLVKPEEWKAPDLSDLETEPKVKQLELPLEENNGR